MRRAMVIGAVLLAIAVVVSVGIGAYNAGFHEGLEDSGRAVEVVRVEGWGFPFGLILFPLFIIGIILLVRGAFGRRHWGPGSGGPGHGGPGGPGHWKAAMLEEWHRHQHGEGGGEAGAGGEPARA
jgi:hypothetical protein